MRPKAILASVAVLIVALLAPATALAEGTSCSFPTVIVPDGRITTSTIPNATTFWYLFDGTAGRSFSIEFKDPLEAWNNFPGTLTVFATGSCVTAGTSVSTTGIDPQIPNTARRVSLTLTGSRQWFTLENTSGGTRPYSVSVTETTLFSPRWSTFGGFSTSWGFHNTTNSSRSVTLTVIDTAGTQVATDTFAVAAGRAVFRSTTGLAIAANKAGSAFLAHNGPPGAIQGDGFMVSPDGLTGFPVKFEPRSQQK